MRGDPAGWPRYVSQQAAKVEVKAEVALGKQVVAKLGVPNPGTSIRRRL